MMDLPSLLGRSPTFSRLAAADLAELAAAFRVDRYPDRHVFIKAGERDQSVYLLVEGEIAVLGTSAQALNRLRPGSLFGLMALVDSEPRSATCRADGACTVATLATLAVAVLFSQSSPVACAFQKAVAVQLAKDFRNLDVRLRTAWNAPAKPWR